MGIRVAYAASGQRTILVDCDMRKPSIHKHLGFEQTVGLVDILKTDTESPEKALRRDPKSDVNLILGARSADIPTDQLILSSGFARLIGACRKGFDIVVIDTPLLGRLSMQPILPNLPTSFYLSPAGLPPANLKPGQRSRVSKQLLTIIRQYWRFSISKKAIAPAITTSGTPTITPRLDQTLSKSG